LSSEVSSVRLAAVTTKVPRALIGWSVAAWAGTGVALVSQLWIWVVLATRKVSHGSGDYPGYQYVALVLGILPALISLVLAVWVLRRRRSARRAAWVIVADLVCLALVGALVVPPALTVFRFAPTDDAVFSERIRFGYFADGDPGSDFNPDEAQYALQTRVDAIAHDLGLEDEVVPYDDANRVARDRARDGTSPAGNSCTTYFESFTLPSSVDQGSAAATVSSTWVKQSAAGEGAFVEGRRSLVFTVKSGGSNTYTPEDRNFVTQTDCLIEEPARPLGG
jgi:hypothetical protein